MKEIAEVFSNIGGKSLEDQASETGTHKFISIGNYSKDGRYIDNGQKVPLNKKTEPKLLKRNDLVMVLNDKTRTGDIIGSTILIEKDNSYIYNQRSERLIPNKAVLNPKYCWFLFNSPQRRKKIFAISQGGTQIYVNFSAVRHLKISFPPLPEQQKIAEFLTAVDGRFLQLIQKKALLEDYKRGVMQQLFTQAIRFKDDNGDDFSDWEEAKLGDVLNYEQPTKYIVTSTEYKDEHSTPVLTAGKTFILGYSKETFGLFDKGLPVIIFDDFTTAYKFVDFPFKVKSSAMKILSVKNGSWDIRFVHEAFSTIRFPISGHKRYWIAEYQFMTIPAPSVDEQSKIADFLSAIDRKIESVATQITETQTFKKGLLQQMFV